MFIPRKILEKKLCKLIEEDIGLGDVTSALVIPEGIKTQADIIVKSDGVIAGLEEASIITEMNGLSIKKFKSDGNEVKIGDTVAQVSGDARTLLTIERIVLNLISRMSGIATLTKTVVEKIKRENSITKIASTRKTAPGLAYFDKKAIVIGGGEPHRLHLDDMILIKDNHITINGSIENAIKMALKNKSFTKKIEIETKNPQEALKAAKLGADIIMLDNFAPEQIEETKDLFKKEKVNSKVILEVSGGITADNILKYAKTEVDIISVGELTHSVKALDVSLEIGKNN